MRVCDECGKNRAAKFFRGERGRICTTCQKRRASDANHARRIQDLYGITPEEYQALLEWQHGVCGACGQARRYRLNVDHDHKVEREQGSRASVRGLLCRRCNKLLRDARDSIELLLALAEYLRNPPAKEVIT